MALMPGVELRLLPENMTEPRITPTQLIFHSIVGSAEGAWSMFRFNSNLESTFINRKVGKPWQLVDSTRQADANFKANVRAGSIESEDNGNPNTDPWNINELEWNLRIAGWYHEVHDLPLRQCRSWDDPGYGYHSLFPGIWTPDVTKTCPGTIRKRQYDQEILPRIKRGQFTLQEGITVPQLPKDWLDMADKQEVSDLFDDRINYFFRDAAIFGQDTVGDSLRVAAIASQGAEKGVNGISPLVTEVRATGNLTLSLVKALQTSLTEQQTALGIVLSDLTRTVKGLQDRVAVMEESLDINPGEDPLPMPTSSPNSDL